MRESRADFRRIGCGPSAILGQFRAADKRAGPISPMLLSTAVLLTQTLAAPAGASGAPASYSGRESQLRIAVPRLEDEIRVDGVLDEPAWQQAARLTAFSAYAPVDGEPASEPTEVLVFYSPTAIHFSVRAQAAPGSVRATLANRDRLDTEDQVRIFLSTFNDARQALYFAVNPLGVQADGVLVEGTATVGGGFGGLATGREEPDLSPDYVFDSKGRLTSEGYEVEVRIPFKTLRFPSAERQAWGVHVTRMKQARGHEDSWAPARRAAASFLAQGGTLDGLTGLRRGLVLDLTPELTGTTAGAPDAAGRWRYDTRDPGLGGNVRWGVTSNLTLNGTVNPDFSQIEADASQVTFDPRSALFFAEKRPFFLDGLEQFQTPNRLIYTRRIVDPVGAVKLSGKVGGTSLAFLSAVDGEAQSAVGDRHPRYNVLRVQRDLFGQSKAALVVTDKVDGPDSNRVAAADARFAWGGTWNVQLQAGGSWTERGGDVRTGPILQANLERNGRRFGLSWRFNSLGEDFRAESGFIARPRVTNVLFDQRWTFFGGKGSRLESLSSDVVFSGTWRTRDLWDGRGPLERKLHLNNNASLRGGWRVGGSVLIERFDFDSDLYADYRLQAPDGSLLPFTAVPYIHNFDWVFSFSTPQFSGFSASFERVWGRDENFFEWSPADIDYVAAAVDYRPTEKLRLEWRYIYQDYVRRSDRSYVGARHLPRLKVEYQLTRHAFLRVVGDYDVNRQDTLRDDGRSELPIVIRDPATGRFEPASGFQQKRLRLDFLFSYQPVPGTVLFAGYGSRLTDPERRGPSLRRESDGFFLKISYLFRV